MLTMSQINHIKDLSNCGYRITEISKKTGADSKTIRKYLAQDDFSPQPPIIQEKPSKLDPFKPIIQEWLDEDKKHWRKQHHTAQRVYARLVEEHGYTGSYSIVQRYMKKCRSIRMEKANLELIWDPGPAQVDFGEADFYEAGKLCRKKYLTVSFPYSNDGYSQVFGGETAECVCQGLQDIFVPVPHFNEIEKYNQKLLALHEKKASELHYKKQVPIRELFEEDRKALLMLPPKRFDVCRYEWLKADGYGKVCMDGKHFYSTKPENANKQVLAGIRAHTIDILTEGGQVITTHRRAFGDNRTDISDYSTTLAVLMKNSGAWGNSGLRHETPDVLRAYMDAQPKEKLKDCLRIMNELTNQYGFQAATSAMEMACTRGSINICDVSVLASMITGYGIYTPPEAGPSLAVYDEMFLKEGGAVS